MIDCEMSDGNSTVHQQNPNDVVAVMKTTDSGESNGNLRRQSERSFDRQQNYGLC